MAIMKTFILALFSLLLASAASFDPSEMRALLTFKDGITSDPSGALETWERDGDPCTLWAHVTCKDGRISSVNLPSCDLSGTISSDLAALEYLTVLQLGNNQLHGPIPDMFGNMKLLRALVLQENSLTGSIPPSLSQCSNLMIVELQHNNIGGGIPQSLTTLSNLQVFNVANNNLTGRVPTNGAFAAFPPSYFEGNPNLCGKSTPCN